MCHCYCASPRAPRKPNSLIGATCDNAIVLRKGETASLNYSVHQSMRRLERVTNGEIIRVLWPRPLPEPHFTLLNLLAVLK